MKAEYDFSKGVRGKFADRIPPDAVFVQFDPDVGALLDGPGTLGERLRSLATGRGTKRGGAKRLIRTVVLSGAEYRALRPVLEKIGGRVTADLSKRKAPGRRRKAG